LTITYDKAQPGYTALTITYDKAQPGYTGKTTAVKLSMWFNDYSVKSAWLHRHAAMTPLFANDQICASQDIAHQEQHACRASQVTMYGKYRTSDLPDRQIDIPTSLLSPTTMNCMDWDGEGPKKAEIDLWQDCRMQCLLNLAGLRGVRWTLKTGLNCPEKPADLYNQLNPDWASTVKMGHIRTFMSPSPSKSRYNRSLNRSVRKQHTAAAMSLLELRCSTPELESEDVDVVPDYITPTSTSSDSSSGVEHRSSSRLIAAAVCCFLTDRLSERLYLDLDGDGDMNVRMWPILTVEAQSGLSWL
ncbi:hypothetical protein MAR_013895, partial [Mya arenaria]